MPRDWGNEQTISHEMLQPFVGGQCFISGGFTGGRILKGEVYAVSFDRPNHKLVIVFKWLAYLEPPKVGEPFNRLFDSKSGKFFSDLISHERIAFARWVKFERDHRIEVTSPNKAQLGDNHLGLSGSGIIEFYTSNSEYLLDPKRVCGLIQ